MTAFIKKFGIALLLVIALLFCFQNLEPLSQTASFRFNLYLHDLNFETRPFPLVFLLSAAFLLGMFAAGVYGVLGKMSRSMDLRRRDRRIRELEKELEECRGRALPGGQPASISSAGVPPPSVRLEDNPTL